MKNTEKRYFSENGYIKNQSRMLAHERLEFLDGEKLGNVSNHFKNIFGVVWV